NTSSIHSRVMRVSTSRKALKPARPSSSQNRLGSWVIETSRRKSTVESGSGHEHRRLPAAAACPPDGSALCDSASPRRHVLRKRRRRIAALRGRQHSYWFACRESSGEADVDGASAAWYVLS